ncbi:MAG: adenylate/guanylate cyclase domain-containing protein [Ignavibacteriales bacterium]|nr:adenylate/guanylate cyclase domain-containing protein [Ignavibacteriales bacterium]
MKFNPVQLRINFSRLSIISIFWWFAAVYFVSSEYFNIVHFAKPLGINYKVEYNFSKQLFITMLFAFIAAFLLGAFEVFYLRDRLRKFSFGFILFLKSCFYIISMFLFITAASFLYQTIFTNKSFFDPRVIEGVKHHLFSELFFNQLISWSVVIIITNFVLQVSDKFGQGVLLNYLSGKYHEPKEEERVFMFLDLKSSTTIAEQLGHNKYFQFINEYFNDMTDPILFSRGEIYQYVGDEIVVSWQIKNGLADNNCINCFFKIKEAVENVGYKYKAKYGFVPEFKAGIHIGKAVAGEVGVIKKEIVFSGDVLNTAARIQTKCNEYGVKLLASEDLIAKLNFAPDYKAVEIGEVTLRGKQSPTRLYSIEKK